MAAAAPERRRLDARPPRAAVLRPPRRGSALRLLPAPRHRRLQDPARHPALRRPGVAGRAGRGRTSAGPRPRAQGAPDVGRPEQHRPPAPAEQAAERAPRRAARKHPRADQGRRGRRRDQLDGWARGAAVRAAGADPGRAVLLRLRGDGRRALTRRDPRARVGGARLPPRPGADRAVPRALPALVLPGAAGARRPLGGECATVADTFERAATAATFRPPVETSVG